MEFHRGLAKKARPFRRAPPPVAREIRPRRIAAIRPGQMVSRRTASALGARVLLAQGWRSHLEGRFADRGRIKKLRPQRERREGTCAAHWTRARSGNEVAAGRP